MAVQYLYNLSSCTSAYIFEQESTILKQGVSYTIKEAAKCFLLEVHHPVIIYLGVKNIYTPVLLQHNARACKDAKSKSIMPSSAKLRLPDSSTQ